MNKVSSSLVQAAKKGLEILIAILLRQAPDGLGEIDTAREPRPALLLQELRHDDDVVDDAIVIELVFLFEVHHESLRSSGETLLALDRSEEVIQEPVQNRFVLAQGVGFLRPLNDLQITL